mgnify:CR=1 FL=1
MALRAEHAHGFGVRQRAAGGVQRAKVMFDYEAEDETNITIAVGGVVVVTDSSDADWWQGYNEGEEDKEGEEYQRLTWEALKKSINGLVNKVAVSNIQYIIPEVFGENLIDVNNGDHADTVADDLNNKVIARFLEEV